MAVRTNKAKLPNAKTLGSPNERLAVSSKVAKFLSDPRFNKVFDFYQVLAQVCGDSIIRLPIPETLISNRPKGGVFLHTDRDGIVRSRSEDRCTSLRLTEEFVSLCSFKHKNTRNLNPQGIHFPKFITYRENAVEFTIMKNSTARRYVAEPFQKVQRYVVPSGFTAKKLVVLWRRTKATKVYDITSRLSLKIKKGPAALTDPVSNASTAPIQEDPLHLDLPFIASIRNIKSCDVRKETRLDDQGESLLAAVNNFVATYLLEPQEQLEETVFSMMKALTGEWVLLNCARARTSRKEDGISLNHSRLNRRSSLSTVEELSTRISRYETLDRVLQKPLPKISDVQTASLDSYRPQLFGEPKSPFVEDIASTLISDHISSVAENWDRMSLEARARKEACAEANKLRYIDFPPHFLKKCTDRAYLAMSQQPKFARYFAVKEQILNHIANSVAQVFSENTSKTKIRSIHKHIGVSESDFVLYIKIFSDAVTEEGGTQEDIARVESFLSSFKEDVVTKRRASVMDMSG